MSFRYTGWSLLEHVTISGCSSATEVTGALSARSAAVLTWAGTLKQSLRCYKHQSLKLNFCNAHWFPYQMHWCDSWNDGFFPACHWCRQVFSAVTWQGLWKEISIIRGQLIPLLSHTDFRMTGLAFRDTYSCPDCKGPCVTSSILSKDIPARLTAFKSGQMLFILYVIYNMNQDCG